MANEDICNLTNSISNLSLNKEITESENSDNKTDNISNSTKLTGLFLPKINSKIIYHNPDVQPWNEALVLGRAVKAQVEIEHGHSSKPPLYNGGD